MKTCSKCGPKPFADFNKGVGGYHSYCRSCQKDYDRARYDARKPAECYRAKTKREMNAARNRELIRRLKSEPCSDCQKSFHFAAMDFDHRPGETKSFDVATGAGQGYGEKRMLAEIAKCELVCANCHRVRTFLRRQDTGV